MLSDLNKLLSHEESYEGFDVILCNPPYLSSKAMSARVTLESKKALVGGLSGFDVYESICSSLRNAIDENIDHRILKPGGCIILQLSAASTAYASVSAMLIKHGFHIVDVILEEQTRVVRRGLVAKATRAKDNK
jgi:methylase of polypeptide subunit release factors